MELADFFATVENTLMSRFHQSKLIQHAGDKGENRENILQEFLIEHLPKRYGVVKGEVITKDGSHSYAADLIIYDVMHCPVLYAGKTAVLPIEGVYGVIEVKSRLSKEEFVDAYHKIESFKRLAPRDLSLITTREYVTVHRPSRPFGIIFGYELDRNSLGSLEANWNQENRRVQTVNYFPNLACVLGAGVLHHEQVNLTKGEKDALLDTDEFVRLTQTLRKRKLNNEAVDEILTRVVFENLENRSFGRFIVYLLIMLSKMKLSVPDLGTYLDPDLPRLVFRES